MKMKMILSVVAGIVVLSFTKIDFVKTFAELKKPVASSIHPKDTSPTGGIEYLRITDFASAKSCPPILAYACRKEV